MSGRIGIALTVALLACTSLPAPPMSPSPPGSTAVGSTTASREPSPPPAATALPPSPGIKASAVARIPRTFVYIDTDPGPDVTLWLADLSAGAAPTAVAQWTGGGNSFSASRDGEIVVIMARGAHSPLALHLLRPLRGEATILFEGTLADSRAFYPRVSPDGRYVAFALSSATGWDGIWLDEIGTNSTRQLAAQQPGMTSPAFLLDWSDDSQWLSYAADDPSDPGFGPKVVIQNIVDGRRIAVGRGSGVAWRSAEPRILFVAQTGKGHQGAFGASVSTYDLSRQQATELFAIDPRVTKVAWSPTRDAFLYLTDTTGCPYRSSIWTRTLSGETRKVGLIDSAREAWWSADGSTIYALVRGTGQDADLVDASSGLKVTTLPNGVPARTCP